MAELADGVYVLQTGQETAPTLFTVVANNHATTYSVEWHGDLAMWEIYLSYNRQDIDLTPENGNDVVDILTQINNIHWNNPSVEYYSAFWNNTPPTKQEALDWWLSQFDN